MDEQRVPRQADAETTTTPRPQVSRRTSRREFVRRLSSAAAIASTGAPTAVPEDRIGRLLQTNRAHALMHQPPPAFSSAEEAGEIAENYWMALSRDVPFASYDSAAVI